MEIQPPELGGSESKLSDLGIIHHWTDVSIKSHNIDTLIGILLIICKTYSSVPLLQKGSPFLDILIFKMTSRLVFIGKKSVTQTSHSHEWPTVYP